MEFISKNRNNKIMMSYRIERNVSSVSMLLLSITVIVMPMTTFVQSFPTTNNKAAVFLRHSPNNGSSLFEDSLHRHIRQTTIQKEESSRSGGSQSGYEPYLEFKSILPEEVVVDQNEHFTLECDVSGTPNPIIYWLRNGRLVQQQSDSESDEQTLSFMLTSVHQQGQLGLSRVKSRLFLDCLSPESDSDVIYTCIAATPFEQKRSSTKLIVRTRSSSLDDKEMEIFANQNSIENRHRSRLPKSPSSRYHKIINLYNDDSSTATSCLAKKSLNSPARIYFWTETTVENMGHDGLIHCRSTGYPRPTVDWFLNDQLEPIESDYDGKYQILPSGDLLIRNITFDDMGLYRCSTHNDYGSDSVEKIFFYPILKE